MLVAIFVVTAVSNGANLTDGLDGLATGVSVPIVAVLGVLAYLSGHIVYADYLNIMYIPQSGELVVFAAAFVGALVGFLWYNSFPAQIFMGDTGSLAIGGVIAVFALCIRKELLLPLLCGVFLVRELLGDAAGRLLQVHAAAGTVRGGACCSWPRCTTTTRRRASSRRRSSRASGSSRCCLRPSRSSR